MSQGVNDVLQLMILKCAALQRQSFEKKNITLCVKSPAALMKPVHVIRSLSFTAESWQGPSQGAGTGGGMHPGQVPGSHTATNATRSQQAIKSHQLTKCLSLVCGRKPEAWFHL